MAVLPIVMYGSKVLRQRALEITEITPELKRLAHDMLDTMYDAKGIGLAAPQIGKAIRLVVVDVDWEEEVRDGMVLFNPVITRKSGESTAEEGCLSIPGLWGEVTRPEVVSVEAQDIDGKPFHIENADGMLSRCIQHEIDHLDGVLFTDRVSATEKVMLGPKLKKMAKETKAESP